VTKDERTIFGTGALRKYDTGLHAASRACILFEKIPEQTLG
jgi:hypothetical protein